MVDLILTDKDIEVAKDEIVEKAQIYYRLIW